MRFDEPSRGGPLDDPTPRDSGPALRRDHQGSGDDAWPTAQGARSTPRRFGSGHPLSSRKVARRSGIAATEGRTLVVDCTGCRRSEGQSTLGVARARAGPVCRIRFRPRERGRSGLLPLWTMTLGGRPLGLSFGFAPTDSALAFQVSVCARSPWVRESAVQDGGSPCLVTAAIAQLRV